MSKQLTDKTLTPLRNDYFVVQVQPNSMTHQLWGSVLVDEVKYLTMHSPGRFKNHTVKIPPGDYTIVGLAKDLREEQAREMVECGNCAGTGQEEFANERVGCCNKPNRDGSCCGNGVPEQFPDVRLCSYCGGINDLPTLLTSKNLKPETSLIIKLNK